VTHFQNLAFQAIRSAVLSVSALGTVAFAQSPNTSGLHGTVTDQTRGVVSEASVTLESADARKRNIKTDREGRYRFEQIPPGPYTLMVSAQGFMDFAAKVELTPQVATLLDVGLKVAAIAVEVDVKETPGLSTEPRKNLSALILTGKDLAGLPDDPQLLLIRILQMAGSTGRPTDVAVYVNGFREYKRLPPKNTIEMIRINSNLFSAEFSQPNAQRIEIITKPGSDSFHGDIGVQARTSALEARNPISGTKPETEYYNYNGYLQGPISEGHVGFLVSSGLWQQDDNAFINATVLAPTGLVEPFAATVLTPTRVRSGMAQLDFRLLNQLVNVSYVRTDESYRNQGLESGFDLPEHGYDRSAKDDVGRLWWTAIGRNFVNDLRFEITRGRTATDALVTAPAVLVLDAFNAGGNQNAGLRRSTVGMQASEALTVQQGSHTFKTGIQIEMTRQDTVDRTGFGGTFTFGSDVERDAFGTPVLNEAGEEISISPIETYRRTVLGLPGHSPTQFWIVRGNPDVGVEQQHISWFALDDWSPSRRVTLSYGVRQEVQNNVKLRLNLAARGGLSLLLDEKGNNAIKVGAGIFHGRVEPDITYQTKKLDGTNRQQLIIERPAFSTISPGSLDQILPVQSAIYTKSDDLRIPFSFVTTVGYERQFPGGLFGIAQYLFGKGTNLLRLRNITAPLPGASGPATSPVLQFESTGRSLQHQLMLGLRENIADLTLYANYTFGKKRSDTDGPYTLAANSHDLSAEYGWAADDLRHQFVAGATVEIPGDMLLNPSIVIASGRPFNITTGFDNNNDTVFTDRPAFAKPGDVGAIATPFGLFNPNPQPGDTIIPRNFGREARQVTLDVNISKVITKGLMVTIDVQNLPNYSRLFGTNGIVTTPVFGMPNQALNGRRVELMIRYGF
jgi:Carboxypeptidase regulatory-like domain